MKANELMIGDWVMYNPNVFIEDEYEPHKDCESVQIKSGEDIDLAIEGCFAPIPLTEEILRANGFVDENATNGLSFRWYVLQTNQEYGDVWGRTNQTIVVAWREYNSDVYVNRPYGTSTQQKISVADIRYVHELQRALRCCGLFDLANNFKI